MPRFRILHISDLHLCLEPNRRNLLVLLRQPKHLSLRILFNSKNLFFPASYDPDLAEAVARFAYINQSVYDLILLTGDIATTGLREDLDPALEFVDQPVRAQWVTSSQKPSLQGARKPVFLLPGNHDRYRNNWGGAGGCTFDTIFHKYWRRPKKFVQSMVLSKRGQSDRLALIAADFSLAQNSHASHVKVKNKYGQGKAYSSRIRNLVDATSAVRDQFENVVVVWVLHFPPIDGLKRSLRLIDRSKVQQAANQCQIPLVLAGHVHRKDDVTFSMTRVCSAGSATSVDEGGGNWLHMLELDISNGALSSITRTDHKWNQITQSY